LGDRMAVTWVPSRYQWAETHSTALGRGRDVPIALHPSENGFRSMAFIGLPCPRKIAGIGAVM
jgi:hypothetical protein